MGWLTQGLMRRLGLARTHISLWLWLALTWLSCRPVDGRVTVLTPEKRKEIARNASRAFTPLDLPKYGDFVSKMSALLLGGSPSMPTISTFKTHVLKIQQNCSRQVKFVRAHPHGYGSMINYAMLSAVAAWVDGKRVAFVPDAFSDDAKAYYDANICEKQHGIKNVLACMFKRLTPTACDDADFKSYQALVMSQHNPYSSPLNFEDLRSLRELVTQKGSRVFKEPTATPWFWSRVNKLLFQPNTEFYTSIKSQIVKDEKTIEIALAKFKIKNTTSTSGGGDSKSNEVYACVHMRGAEKFFDTAVYAPEVYARAALQKLVALKIKTMGIEHASPPYILVISEDEDRTKVFIEYIKKASAQIPVIILNPIPRQDSRKYLHVTQLVSALNKCSAANAIIATISSNIARLLLYFHIQRKVAEDSSFIDPSFTSLDRWALMHHAKIDEDVPIISIDRPPFYPT